MLPNEITIVGRRTWEELVGRLRQVTLLGDAAVLPYKDAVIESRSINWDEVSPISKYVLKGQLKMQRQLHGLFLDQGINTFDLHGDLSDVAFRMEGEMGTWLLSPPIVEESQVDGGKAILTDGEHRLWLAREMGQKIRVVWISGVPRELPQIALPLKWNEVVEYDQVPELIKKRDYRFKTLKDFPDVSSFSKAQITEENFRYFFYRDLSPVATTAVRPVGMNGKLGA